jgi:hypothetical protein
MAVTNNPKDPKPPEPLLEPVSSPRLTVLNVIIMLGFLDCLALVIFVLLDNTNLTLRALALLIVLFCSWVVTRFDI